MRCIPETAKTVIIVLVIPVPLAVGVGPAVALPPATPNMSQRPPGRARRSLTAVVGLFLSRLLD